MLATDIRVVRICDRAELDRALDCGLIEAFQSCFGKPPYDQYHAVENIEGYFRKYQIEGILFLAWAGERCVGFGASLPLTSALIYKAEMEIDGQLGKFDADFLREHLGEDPKNIQYFAELGVIESLREQGIGTELAQNVLASFANEQVWIVRVLAVFSVLQNFYRQFGFEPLPVVQHVNFVGTDGQRRSNRRLIFAKY